MTLRFDSLVSFRHRQLVSTLPAAAPRIGVGVGVAPLCTDTFNAALARGA